MHPVQNDSAALTCSSYDGLEQGDKRGLKRFFENLMDFNE